MKVHFVSDVHNEFEVMWREVPIDPCDLAIFAGDIDTGLSGLMWVRDYFSELKCLYVPGNHEFYGMGDIKSMMDRLDTFADKSNILSLCVPGRSHIIDTGTERVGVIGGTLWTDMCLFGEPLFAHCTRESGRRMNDYTYIMYEDIQSGISRPLRVVDTLEFHQQFIEGMVAAYDSLIAQGIEKIIVATHMGPSIKSIAQKYIMEMTSAAYASNLEQWIIDRPAIKLWIHGHVHSTFDYMVGQCRVMTNPRGYTKNRKCENRDFVPNLIVEI